MYHALRQRSTRRLVIFTLPLFLLFLGIRVPNVSRPQKPKSTPRAVLETSVEKSVQLALANQCDEPVAVGWSIFPLTPVGQPLPFHMVAIFVSSLLLLRLSPPRAPPLFSLVRLIP